MQLTITRTWKPVTNIVSECQECPWFVWEKDGIFGAATLPMCEHPKYNGGVIVNEMVISDLCPERKINMNKTDTELDKWKDVAKKLNLALIHCFSWIDCDECPETKYCEKCLAQIDIMKDAVEKYYKIIKESDYEK